MKTFTKQAAQGDLLIKRVESIPSGLKKAAIVNGAYVVAHSETGHNHVVDAAPHVEVYETDNPLLAYMRVIEAMEATETLLRHLRGHDTHETISIPPGNYELRRQREYTPEGWRRAQD